MYTSDETLFLFEKICRHHRFDQHKKEDVDAVQEMVQDGREKCEWSDIAERIAIEHPKEYGAKHPAGEISRQALKNRVRFYLLESTASGLSAVGERFQRLSLQ